MIHKCMAIERPYQLQIRAVVRSLDASAIAMFIMGEPVWRAPVAHAAAAVRFDQTLTSSSLKVRTFDDALIALSMRKAGTLL